MEQIKISNDVNDKGDPAGGRAEGIGFSIVWQNGPVNEVGRDGAMVEEVLSAVVNRLDFYQTSRYRCKENDEAIELIMEAINCLNERTRKRVERKVEGHYIV